jgi:TetR/AcrR family transcriptional regulator
MTDEEKNTEKTILEAAKKIFLEKGFDGARMQEIADEAKINKSLVHYYFRTKEKLFDAIFLEAFQKFVPRALQTIASDQDLFEKITAIIDTYIDMLIQNPHIPSFILHEINRNPEKIIGFFKEAKINPELFIQTFMAEVKKGTIRPIHPIHLIINMLSMCIFPFAAKPILKGIMFKNDENAYLQFIEERKKEVTEFIIHSIKI